MLYYIPHFFLTKTHVNLIQTVIIAVFFFHDFVSQPYMC